MSHSRHDKTGQVASSDADTKLCALADHMIDHVYLSSAYYRLEYANPAIMDKRRKPRKNTSCYKAINNHAKVCPWWVNERVIAGETTHHELRNPRDGKTYDIVNIPFTNPDGSVSKLTIMHDISAQQEEKTASESACKLKTIAEMIATVSHEINNPLQVISGVAEILLQKDLPADTRDTRESVRTIITMTERIQEVVRHIQETRVPKTSSYTQDIDMLDNRKEWSSRGIKKAHSYEYASTIN